MIQITQLARRALPLLALALAAGACDRVDPTEPLTSAPVADAVSVPEVVSFASSNFRGGIPFGVFHLPKEQYGIIYTGSLGNIYPAYLIGYLEAARRSGTKVMLSLPGSTGNFQNSDKSFSMSMWKRQVDRFKDVNFSSYINDGTVIGHYILDEPHDPANWGGRTISPATVDEMAKYSKQLWPNLPTIVRSWPHYLKGYNFKYLDAAWAQYSERQGPVAAFIAENVRDAKASGLALVVGMNQLTGGSSKGLRGYYDGRYSMNASELEAWGSVLLGDSYPCAFISWKYDAGYMGRSDIKTAMSRLAQKAQDRSSKSCRAAGAAEPEVPAGEEPGTELPPVPPETGGANGGATSGIELRVSANAEESNHRMVLTWSGANGSRVDVYRDGSLRITTENDGKYTNLRSFRGRATYVYKLCERGTSRCSNQVTVTVQ